MPWQPRPARQWHPRGTAAADAGPQSDLDEAAYGLPPDELYGQRQRNDAHQQVAHPRLALLQRTAWQVACTMFGAVGWAQYSDVFTTAQPLLGLVDHRRGLVGLRADVAGRLDRFLAGEPLETGGSAGCDVLTPTTIKTDLATLFHEVLHTLGGADQQRWLAAMGRTEAAIGCRGAVEAIVELAVHDRLDEFLRHLGVFDVAPILRSTSYELEDYAPHVTALRSLLEQAAPHPAARGALLNALVRCDAGDDALDLLTARLMARRNWDMPSLAPGVARSALERCFASLHESWIDEGRAMSVTQGITHGHNLATTTVAILDLLSQNVVDGLPQARAVGRGRGREQGNPGLGG